MCNKFCNLINLMLKSLNIKKSRKLKNYSFNEYCLRIIWKLFSPLFFLSPRPLFLWRKFILVIFGAKIGKKVNIYPSAKIYYPWNLSIGDESSIGEWVLIYNLGKTFIGRQTTISHRSHICAGTHDYSSPEMPLIRPPIKIGSKVWICSDSFIGPDIKIGDGAIVSAGSVVTKNVKPWNIIGGNPAKFIKMRKIVKTEK